MSIPLRIALIGVFLVVAIVLFCVRARVALPDADDEAFVQTHKKRRNFMMLGVASLWLGCGLLFGIFAKPSEGLHIDVFAPRMMLFGASMSTSVVLGWAASGLVLLVAICIRLFAVPKFQEQPKGLQLVLETIVDFLRGYTKEKAMFVSEPLNAYMLTLALYLVSCAVLELFSLRPPTADLIATLSLALITFIMINYYGFRKKGVGGRIKSFTKPTPIVFPFKILSDIAVPISLACRLFGNMLGGMIVVHLVYLALGAFSVGIPAVLGLYFNVFHPLIQVFIFVTLSLTFIGEAAE